MDRAVIFSQITAPMDSPWFVKHRPSRFTELYFSDETHFRALEWLRSCEGKSILHITGGYGSGKTSLVYSVARALGYNVVEYADVREQHLSSSRTLSNAQNLLLVDEGDAPNIGTLHRLAETRLPVVVTSTSLFLRDITTLKVGRPSSDHVLDAVKSIMRKEGVSLDSRIILRLSEMCCHDFRAVMNYCQLFSNGYQLKDLKTIERVSSANLFATCKTILGKRTGLTELERLYSPKALALCLSSIGEDAGVDRLKCFESLSDISMLPDKYQFLVLDPLNRIRCEFVYRKEETAEPSGRHGHEDPVHFLPFYKRDLQRKASVLHLQRIFETYRIEHLTSLDREIRDFVDFTPIEKRAFRYKFNIGSSSAVRRDTTVGEIMEM